MFTFSKLSFQGQPLCFACLLHTRQDLGSSTQASPGPGLVSRDQALVRSAFQEGRWSGAQLLSVLEAKEVEEEKVGRGCTVEGWGWA